MIMPAYLLGALVFMSAIVIFVLQNNAPVAVHFINWHTSEVSLALVALIAALGGALITFLVDSFRAFKTGRKLRELINHNKKLEREVLGLKAKIDPPQEKS
jgi:uncharacterized integral membrane protein